jgi:hypothetical protein
VRLRQVVIGFDDSDSFMVWSMVAGIEKRNELLLLRLFWFR